MGQFTCETWEGWAASSICSHLDDLPPRVGMQAGSSTPVNVLVDPATWSVPYKTPISGYCIVLSFSGCSTFASMAYMTSTGYDTWGLSGAGAFGSGSTLASWSAADFNFYGASSGTSMKGSLPAISVRRYVRGRGLRLDT